MISALRARPVRAVIVIVLLLAVAVGLWLWSRAGSSTPVSPEAALQTLRAAGGADDAATRPGVPRAGVYTYHQSGSERGGAGPLKLSRDLPAEARLVITPAAGGYGQELDISEEHIEGVRVRVDATGSHEVARRTKVTFVGVGQDDRRALTPPPLSVPRVLAAGKAWSGRYSAGGLPVTFRSSIVRSEEVEVGGRRMPVWVIRTVADTGGPHPGTRTDTIWWSPALALPLRWEIDMGIRGVFSLTTRARLTLASTTPEV